MLPPYWGGPGWGFLNYENFRKYYLAYTWRYHNKHRICYCKFDSYDYYHRDTFWPSNIETSHAGSMAIWERSY